MLAHQFFILSAHAQHAMQRALDSGPASPRDAAGELPSPSTPGTPPMEIDMHLPKVCEALVLVTQCITTIALDAEDPSADPGIPSFKHAFRETPGEGAGRLGLVESLIGTSRRLRAPLLRRACTLTAAPPTPSQRSSASWTSSSPASSLASRCLRPQARRLPPRTQWASRT